MRAAMGSMFLQRVVSLAAPRKLISSVPVMGGWRPCTWEYGEAAAGKGGLITPNDGIPDPPAIGHGARVSDLRAYFY